MCQRQSFFRVNANCSSIQEGRRGSFTAVFYLQGANWDRAKEVWGCPGWWQNGGLISSSVEILGTLFGSVTFMRLPFLQQTLKQERYPLATVCRGFSLLAKCLLQVMGWGKPLQPTSDAPTSDTPRNRPQEVSCASPLLLSADRWVAPAPSEVPCMGMQWPRTSGWSPSL